MLRKLNHLICCFLLLTAIASCEVEKIIDLEPDYHKQLVCTGFIMNGKGVSVFLQTAQHPLSPGIDTFAIDATVKLISNNGLMEQLYPISLNFFESHVDFTAMAGINYNIVVTTPDFGQTISEQITVPHAIGIDSARFFRTREHEGIIHVYFNDPAGPNYYALKVSRYSADGIADDSDGYYKLISPFSVFDDVASLNGIMHRRIESVSTNIYVDDTVLPAHHANIVLYHLDQASYFFFSSLKEAEGSAGDMWVEPVVVFSNIINGTGIFGAYATDTLTINLDYNQ
jgi:hypothetical protein